MKNTQFIRGIILIILTGLNFVVFAQIPTTGLVAHYKFEETSGTTCNDETGNNNGTIFDTDFGYQGVVGNCYFWNNDDKIEISDAIPTYHYEEFSISFWAKRTGGGVIILMDLSDGYYVGFDPDSNYNLTYGIYVTLNGNWEEERYEVSTSAITLSDWNHYCIISTGSSMAIYINGVE